MIISGRVQTVKGPLGIQKIEEGAFVVTDRHMPVAVKTIEKEVIEKAYYFKHNQALVLSEGTKILTPFGWEELQEKSYLIKREDGTIVPDTIAMTTAEFGYKITLEQGTSLWVEGYGVEVNHA